MFDSKNNAWRNPKTHKSTVIVQYGASNLKSTVQLQKHGALEITGPNQVKEGSLESSRNQPKAGLTLEHLAILNAQCNQNKYLAPFGRNDQN